MKHIYVDSTLKETENILLLSQLIKKGDYFYQSIYFTHKVNL